MDDSIVKKFKIDPWLCMPLLGTTEFLKIESISHSNENMTKNGYQPLLDNPILWPQFKDLYSAIKTEINKELEFPWKIRRSWVVSYNKDGWQDCHTHHNSIVSGVLCLIGNKDSGDLEFETGEKINMLQGDMVLFPSTIKHWAYHASKPKTVLSFDIINVDEDTL